MAARQKQRAVTFAVLGLICMLGLCFEFVVIIFEQFVFDKTYYQFTITESITHWVLISVIWGLLGLVLFYVSSRVYGFDFSKKKQLPSKKKMIICFAAIIAAFSLKLAVYGGWKPYLDFIRSGWFQFIFEYIYNLFQAMIILIMAVFAQEAVERLLKSHKIKLAYIPWGGIVLGLSWGVINTVTETNTAVSVCYILLSLLIGIGHIASNKNIYLSYILTVLILLI